MSEFIQDSFDGGLNLRTDSTKINKNECPLLINGRIRNNTIKPIYKPVDLSNQLPSGLKQGIYAAGKYLVVFNDGKCYVKDCELESGFTKVPMFSMDNEVPRIYAEIVPASTVNKKHILASITHEFSNGVSSPVFSNVFTTPYTINGSVAAMVVQDGKTQPWVVFQDGSARQTQRYEQWDDWNREYVPVGKQMLHYDGKLYIVSSDGREIYHSVTGRPLDFMVVIGGVTGAGPEIQNEKLPFVDGNPSIVAHKVDFNPITGISRLNGPEAGFFVSTRYSSYIVTPDYMDTYFGEPSFTNIHLFGTGVWNNYSLIEWTDGDVAFIDIGGIHSFNATRQLTSSSNNDLISGQIYKLFQGVSQTDPCVADFEDYKMFFVDSIYGPIVLVYDVTVKRFISIDMWSGVGRIKQFAEIRTGSNRRLFFITHEDKLFEAFAGEEPETVQAYLGEFTTGNPDTELKPTNLHLVFSNCIREGNVTSQIYSDKSPNSVLSKDIRETINNTIPVITPFNPVLADSVQVVSFDLTSTRQGWKLGIWLRWNADAELTHVKLLADERAADNSTEQSAIDLANALQR
jgi:hypothetical protein